MRILIVGGAGYIGSHAVRECRRVGHEVVVFDNYSTGNPDSVDGVEQVAGDVLEPRTLRSVFENYQFDAVFHFAASSLVGESVANPTKYYRNNVAGTLNLVHAMMAAGVERLIFSSTAAIYGTPQEVPMPEGHPQAPCNPYGHSKLLVEQLLGEIARCHPFRFAALRYFNAAGADAVGDIGEDHGAQESHLIPLVFLAALGLKPRVTIFGDDYDTPDGTCIRDFVHVTDIARAHLLALDRLEEEPNQAFNLGSSEGFSVREVVEEAQQVVGDFPIVVEYGRRRAGDPAVLVASSDRARERLGWEPQFSDLRTILETAWNWHRRHPSGYGSPPPASANESRSALLGDLAVRLGYLEADDVKRALERQDREMAAGNHHKLIGMHMLEMGLLSTTQLIDILKYYDEV